MSLNSLEPASACYSLAISLIYPNCDSVVTLPSSIRKLATVRLTVCELEESGVQLPPLCINIDIRGLLDCIQSLEKSPQWWATYTGYFKQIGQTCYQYLAHLEQQTLLQQYREVEVDLTKMVAKMRGELNDAAIMVESAVANAHEQYLQVIELMEVSQMVTSQWLQVTLPKLVGDSVGENVHDAVCDIRRHVEITVANTIVLVMAEEMEGMMDVLHQTLDGYSEKLKLRMEEIDSRLGSIFGEILRDGIYGIVGIINNIPKLGLVVVLAVIWKALK